MVWNRKQTKNTSQADSSNQASINVVDSNVESDIPKLECCICLEENVVEEQKTECGHCVCNECLDKMTKPICPMCRQEITLSEAAMEKIEAERNAKLKLRAYARLFRTFDYEFYDWIEYRNPVDTDQPEGDSAAVNNDQ